jgi:1-deoxyxylulose-5-phosphate synthase
MARLSQQCVVPWPIAQRGHTWWAASCSWWPTGSSWKVQCETSACVRFGLSIVPFGPLHGGLLAGTQVEEREFAWDKRFGGSGFTGTELEVGRAVERLSQDWNLQPLCRWPGCSPARRSRQRSSAPETVEEITANATAADVILEQAQLDALTALQARDDDS